MRIRIVLLAACLAFGAATQAQEEAPPPKVHKQGGSTYVSGGASEAERKALFKLAPKFPIQLIFQVDGAIEGVSGVKVTIRDISDNVLIEAVSDGPFLYATPPAGGRFTMEAEYKGQKQSFTKDLVGRRYLVLEYKFTSS